MRWTHRRPHWGAWGPDPEDNPGEIAGCAAAAGPGSSGRDSSEQGVAPLAAGRGVAAHSLVGRLDEPGAGPHGADVAGRHHVRPGHPRRGDVDGAAARHGAARADGERRGVHRAGARGRHRVGVLPALVGADEVRAHVRPALRRDLPAVGFAARLRRSRPRGRHGCRGLAADRRLRADGERAFLPGMAFGGEAGQADVVGAGHETADRADLGCSSSGSPRPRST